jgi:predicted DNA-binding WGR domain protein
MGIQRFVKVDPEKNLRRWYAIAWGQTLFGAWAVVRMWGRLEGNWSRCRIEEFVTEDEAAAEAKTQVERRQKRGYAPSEDGR